MKTALVSAANDAYFGLLLDLIHSWQARPESAQIDLCILDVGLQPSQVAILTPMVKRIVTPGWDLEFDHSECPSWFKAMVARPHLPKHFPDYDLLLWMDADTWFCNSEALRLLIHAGKTFDFAIVPELDRTYIHCFQRRPEMTENLHTTYLQGFGQETADRLTTMPILNSGVFAMRTNIPAWGIWSSILKDALQRCHRTLIEQCALNVGVYTQKIRAHFLPSWCNWNCAASRPILNMSTRDLHIQMLPHERISICHLTDLKDEIIDLPCTDGVRRKTSLAYRDIRGSSAIGM